MAVLRNTLKLCAVFLLCICTVYGQSASEYELKAAFLFRFTEFVEWPAETFYASESPVRMCVFGSDVLADALERTIQGERVNGRSLIAIRIQQTEQLSNCHILFISQLQRDRTEAVLRQVRAAPVLTVGDHPDFLNMGGIIKFVTEENRIRFDINLDAVGSGKLQISSKLLRLARVVRPARRIG